MLAKVLMAQKATNQTNLKGKIMQTLRLKNKDEFPVFGLGTFRSQPNLVYDAVKEAIKMGYRHIDCAMLYGNEKEVGQALSDCFKQGIVQRKDLWITSKLWSNSHGKDNVIPALKKSLSDLQLTYLDLYLVHWPVAIKENVLFPQSPKDFYSYDEVPLTNTWEGMIQARQEGLTKHIGVSNYSISKLKLLMQDKENYPEVNQIELHPYFQQKPLSEFCKANGIIITAYAPLGSGQTQELLQDQTIVSIAQKHKMTPAQVLIKWQIEIGNVVIPKSVKTHRLRENFEAQNFKLDSQDLAQIDKLNEERRIFNAKFWEVPNGTIKEEDIWA